MLSAVVEGQSLRSPVSADWIGTNAYSIHQQDVFSFTSNKAALANIQGFAAGAFGEKRFGGETNFYSGVIVLATSNGNFGVQANYYGFENYNESQLGLAYARSLGNSFQLGIQFNHFSFRIPQYNSSSTITFEIGALARLSDQLTAGIAIYNPVGGYLSKVANEKLGASYSFGLGYEPSENVLVSIVATKNENESINISSGLVYQFDKKFFARIGIQSKNASPYAAAGIAIDDLRIDITASYHRQLGISPGVMIIYQPKKQDEMP